MRIEDVRPQSAILDPPCDLRTSRATSRAMCALTKLRSSGSSRPATRWTASLSSRTRLGKASRNRPLMRTVTSMRGRSSTDSGIGSMPIDAAVGVVPHRLHAEQGQHLGDVVAAGAHVAGAPDHQGHAFGIVAGAFAMTADQRLGGGGADAPGRGRRHAADVERVEVPAGRQDVGGAARGCAAGPRRHETARQRRQDVVDLFMALLEAGPDGLLQVSQAYR